MSDDLQKAVNRAAAILKAAGAAEIYLFGSAATGDEHSESDIDLAVSGLAPDRFYAALGQLLLASSQPVDLVDLDIDTPFSRYLRRKGKLLRVA